MIVAPSLHEGARRGLNYAGKMVERFYGRKKRGENNECLRLVMKSSVKHITTYSVMMPSQRWLRKKKACTLFPWTWVATLILLQHLFVTWHFYTHLLLSKYVYEQLLPLCVGVSFFFIAFLLACIFFQTSSAVYCLFVFLSPPKHYCTYTETSPCYRCSHEKCRAGTFAEMSVSIWVEWCSHEKCRRGSGDD